MRRSFVALGPIAVALILSACVGDHDSASRVNAPDRALASGNPNACDFSGMTKAARDYVGAQDVIVKTMIPAMQSAYTSGGTAAATPKGLDILAQVAQVRLTTGQIGTNLDGANLVNAVISAKCSDIQAGVSDATKLEFNAEAALAGGVFEVRGGASALAAVAFGPKTGGGRQQASPIWGITPATGCPITTATDPLSGYCSWPALSTDQKRYLLTAYPTDVDLASDTAAITSALGTDNNGFVVSMMPDITDKSAFLVGICISSTAVDGSGNTVGANLGLHDGDLLGPTTSDVCKSAYPVQAMLETSTWYASLTHRAASWLAPSQLFAQDKSDGGDWVGPTGWSPVSFARITGQGISLKFVNMPKSATVGSYFNVQVQASSSSRVTPGVLVSVSLANNSGVPAGAVIIDGSPVTGTTVDGTGIATIKLRVNKAGGYTFFASGSLAGAATNTTTSTQVVNVKNAKP